MDLLAAPQIFNNWRTSDDERNSRHSVAFSSEEDEHLFCLTQLIVKEYEYATPLQVCRVPRDDNEHVEDELHVVKPRAGGSPQSSQLCFYHEKYGRRALKCRRPCRWSAAQGNSRGRN